ncbi:MAG: type II secretion system protein GspD, partial [Planctomycetota bacterium]
RAIETIEYFPYNIDTSGLKSQAGEGLKIARERDKERELFLREQRQKAAREEAAIWEQRNLAYHHARVRTLMERAAFAFERTEYAESEELTAKVLELEPKHLPALKLNDRARHSRRFKTELETIELKLEEMKRLIEGVYEAAIPYQKIFMFPSDEEWEVVQKHSDDLKRRFEIRGEAESAAEGRIRRTLDTSEVTINFPGTSFNDAIDFLRDVTGLNYVVTATAQEEVDGAEPEISLKLKSIKLKNALELILADAGDLTYRVRQDAIVINTKDDEKDALVLRFYRVDEIIGDRPDYEAPKIALKRPGGDGEGGGGGAILDIGDDDGETGTGFTADKLIELIEQKLGDQDDGSVEFLGGLLMVRMPVEAHRKIEKLLDQLRKTTGIMVTVETRIIDIQDNFLEELGVDFRGLPAIIPNFLGNSLAQQLGFNWTNNNADLDIRSALVNAFSGALGSAAGTPFNITSLGGGAIQYNLLDSFQLQAIVDAVKREQEARQVDAPRVTVFNGQRSHVLTIDQRAYISDIEVNQTGVTPTINPVIGVLNSGSILEARPIVSFDRKFVTLEIQPTIAVNGQSVFQRLQLIQGQGGVNTDITIELPVVSLSEIRTTVTVPDGGTVILGGLKNFLKQENYAGIPIIRHIPLLRNLFERKGFSDLKRSLIVLLTVDITIVREQEANRFNQQGSPQDLIE